MSYWDKRVAEAQAAISEKTTKQIEKQLRKYYKRAAAQVIDDFERTYNKVLLQKAEGAQVTPALLYKLDAYWKMQGQLRQQLQKLGEKQVSLLTKYFELNFFEVYYSIAIPGVEAFNSIDNKVVEQLINQIWVADGKSWSQRIWDNTELLVETLNEELVHCVVTGKTSSQLKQILQERFSVSYERADALAKTEIAHVQTQAARQRYQDYGISKVQIWADKDERRCDVCGKLHKKIYSINESVPIPAHPRCRCCIIPLIE